MSQQASTHNSDAAFQPEGLSFRLRRDSAGTVWLDRNGTSTRVHLHLCFPWTEPQRFLSLRDEDKNELALIKDPDELDADSRAALEKLTEESRFVFPITGIESADPDFELRVWKVRTQGGPRQFQTKLDDWPRPLPDGSLLLRDISGDLYHGKDPDALDPKSRRILWAFMD